MAKYHVKIEIPKHFAGKTALVEVNAEDSEDAKARALCGMEHWIIEVKKK